MLSNEKNSSRLDRLSSQNDPWLKMGQPVVLDDFKPVSESLEWKIGQAYWRTMGGSGFLSNEIPHLITNDGMHAARAADVLYAACRDAADAGRLEEVIEVAELGVGSGLHARLFLNWFRGRCAENGVDFYQRLVFYVTDRSNKTLADIGELGIFDEFADHIRLGQIDALNPQIFVDFETGTEKRLSGLRAVMHSYMLDNLPFDLLHQVDGQWLRLHLQTLIDDVDAAQQASETSLPEAPIHLDDDNAAEIEKLLPFAPFFAVERAYIPVDISDLPFGRYASSFAKMLQTDAAPDPVAGAPGISFVHSHGAAASLVSTFGILREDGFILFNDYGHIDANETTGWHQRFGRSRGIGLNFALIHHILEMPDTRPVRILTPRGDQNSMVHSRLLCRQELPEVENAFTEAFDYGSFEALGQMIIQARDARDHADWAEAMEIFSEAHRLYPENWYILVEWSEVATHGPGDFPLALDLVEKARAMNPMCSPQLHNAYGNAMYEAGRVDDAIECYMTALRLDPDNIRAHGSLARIYSGKGLFGKAVTEVSLAIANDRKGQYRDSLLQELIDILDRRDAARNGMPGG